jgi:hypothetical protein
MAAKCPVCGSADVQALADRNQCLECGAFSNADGEARPGLDDEGRRVLNKALVKPIYEDEAVEEEPEPEPAKGRKR